METGTVFLVVFQHFSMAILKEEEVDHPMLAQELQPSMKISNYNGLTALELCNTKLSTVSFDPYFKFQHVAYIFLSDNKLLTLDGRIFQQYPLLTWLDVRNNALTSFPTSVINHKNLETILLSNNKLKDLPLELGSLPKLTGLDIKGNPLEYPPPEVIDKGLKALIDFLRFKWTFLQYVERDKYMDVQNNKTISKIRNANEQNQEVKRFSEKTKINKNSKLGEKIVNLSLVEHMWQVKLNEFLQIQEKELQKQRDKEQLNKWKDKYQKTSLLTDICRPISKPPFGVYNQFERMLCRKDLHEPIMEKEVRVTTLKALQDIDGELLQLSQQLESLLNHDERDMDPSKEMSISLEEINKLKRILKTISLLRMKN